MTRFLWDDAFRVGDELIDSQHEYLFVLANKLVEATEKDELRACAMELFRYVRAHFRHEETVMKDVGYPGYDAHYAMHEKLLERLSAVSRDIHDNRWNTESITGFMKDWLQTHIVQEDTRLAAFIKGARASN